ncbi:cobyrinate a,c-diamide synthase [Lacibacterium aquatile]|uniref:Cobyrinate a,c-diamide synthase n=1 Tax=Lacibacterium aquatile TaxID=1168082 RepID=A0ABW5DTY4_9PROT
MSALLIAAPRSGSGKTIVTLGLMAALMRRGFKVRGAKSGPDYIDPAFHQAATGLPSLNLDCWAMAPGLLKSLARESVDKTDILLIEASMGLFDGVTSPDGRSGSGADLAKILGLPVLLVLDVSGQSTTAAAVALGLAKFDPAVRVAGVILNRVASDRHLAQVSEAMARIGMPVVGAVRRNNEITVPERHLGLVQAQEQGDLPGLLDRLADHIEAGVDLDAVQALAGIPDTNGADTSFLPPPGQRIAVALDTAFSFFYAHHDLTWRQSGAEILPFSPLADQAPDPSADVCWLPGGYPELHAGRLAAADKFRDGLLKFAQTKPVHGECGGYMALGEALQDADGTWHPMLGLLGHKTSFKTRKLNLGYRLAEVLVDSPFGASGSRITGHEFHYATVESRGGDEAFCRLSDAAGKDLGLAGSRRGSVSGTFFHAIARA